MTGSGGLRRLVQRRWWLLGLVGLVAAHSALYFPVTESHTKSERTFAINPLDKRDVVVDALLRAESNTATQYAPYVALAEIAPESAFLLSARTDAEYEDAAARLYGFAFADSVGSFGRDLVDVSEARTAGSLVASGGAGPGGPTWEIIVDGWSGEVGDPATFLADILAADARVEHKGGVPRVFVWIVAPDGVLVFLEESLLDEAGS